MKENKMEKTPTGGNATNMITKVENLFNHVEKVINRHNTFVINVTLNVTGKLTDEELAKTAGVVAAQVSKEIQDSLERTSITVDTSAAASAFLLAGSPVMVLKAFCEIVKVVGKGMLSVKPVAAEPFTMKSILANPFGQPSPAMIAATFARLLLVV